MRPKQGRWLCGVCRGISLHLQVSVVLVRLLFTAAAFVFGAGIVVYVFLWLTMPVGDPVAAQQLAGEQLAESLPVWPAEGSVSLQDGYLLVCLGEA